MSSEASDRPTAGNKDRPAALVVCSYLGWPITGGVAAAIRQLIYFLHSIGLAIYCTAFKVSDDDQNEFREFEVNLLYPDPPDLYRLDEESISWLHNHETFFPSISKVERVKMVFGFSMVTSLPASAIRDKTFPDASFYLINPYKLDTPLSILGYNKARYKIWKELLKSASTDAKAVFSIGSDIFEYFDFYYDSLDVVVNHHSIMLTPDEEIFKFRLPTKFPVRGKFQILMFVDQNDIAELSRQSAVAQAMNYVADYLHGMSSEPPKWVIVSIPKGREDDIKDSLAPHPHLEVIYRSFDASEAITLIIQSHLLLVPPSSIDSINLSLSTIATGTPLLVPQYSPSQKTIKEYLPEIDPNDVVVDMKSGHTILGDKIKDAVLQYPTYLRRAVEMRRNLQVKAKEVTDKMNMMFAKLICQFDNFKLSIKTAVRDEQDHVGLEVDKMSRKSQLNPRDAQNSKTKSDECAHGGNTGNETNGKSISTSNEEKTIYIHQHKNGHMSVSMRVKRGAPKNDKPMVEVENDLFAHSSTRSNAQHYMNRVTGIHDELHADDIEEGCLTFVIRCGSRDAADALWHAYSCGRLDRMADETFLSIPILDDIGARMVSMATLVNYQEYLQCKQDIADGEKIENAPDVGMLRYERVALNSEAERSKVYVKLRKKELLQKQDDKIQVQSKYTNKGQLFEATGHEMQLSMAKGKEGISTPVLKNENQKLKVQTDTLKIESTSLKEKMDTQRKKLEDRLDEVLREIAYIEEQKPMDELDYLGMSLLFLEDADEIQRKQLTYQIDELYSEVASVEKKYSTEIKKLVEQKEQLTGDLLLTMKKITESQEVDELIRTVVGINKGIVPKDTIRRLSRHGNGPGEILNPCGLTVNQKEEVVVSDRGPDDQPGSVKTVTADTARIISTITFHGLPNNFTPTDVKMSEKRLYYIADDGNKCILVCDAKSRLKQIIDIGEVDSPEVCLGPDNTIFVSDWNGRVFKYSKYGEMISCKKLSKPFITMNSKHQLIVTCNDEHCIYVLDSNLNTLHTFGHEHLVDPCGITVDANEGNVYVADENKVKIFSAQGNYLNDVTVDGEPWFIGMFSDGRIVYKDYSERAVCVIYR